MLVIAAWRSALLVQITQILLKKGKQRQKQTIVNSPAGAWSPLRKLKTFSKVCNSAYPEKTIALFYTTM